jgi:hypothetical protein
MIKYKYIDKRIPKLIFWFGSIFGMLLYSFTFVLKYFIQYHSVSYRLLEGLSYAGAVILGSSIAFTYGILFKVREGGK